MQQDILGDHSALDFIDLDAAIDAASASATEESFDLQDSPTNRSWYSSVKDAVTENVSQYACTALVTYLKAKQLIQSILPF
jgi:hypothetical protein